MAELFALLVPIALIDSVAPIRISLLGTMLARRRPLAAAGAFVAGTFSAYLALGLLVAQGLEQVIAWVFPAEPEFIDFVLGAVVGVVLSFLGIRGLRSRVIEKAPDEEPAPERLGASFVLAWGVTLATLPGAAPLLAGIDQILRAGLSTLQSVLALAFYCAVYVAPLLALVAMRAILGEAATRPLEGISRAVDRWMPRVMATLFLALGALLLADAAGYFLFDHPLL